MNKPTKPFFSSLSVGLFILLLSTVAHSQVNANAWIEAFESCEASFPQMKAAYPEIYNLGYARCMSSKYAANPNHCMDVAVVLVCQNIAESVATSDGPPLSKPGSSAFDYCKSLPARRASFFANREVESYENQAQNCRNMGIDISYY